MSSMIVLNDFTYYQQKTDGTFGKITGESNPLSAIDDGGFIIKPSFADVDGDGKNDFLGTIHDSDFASIVYRKKNSSGQFILQTGNDNPFGNITRWGNPSPTLANLDTDSDLELVIAGESHEHYLHQLKLYNKGTDENNNVVYKPVAQENDPFRWLEVRNGKPYFADFDGDGDSDLLVGRTDGTILFGMNINGEWLFFK